jgi:Raf kinase inhibitor-like YbhB/YbcL family protein
LTRWARVSALASVTPPARLLVLTVGLAIGLTVALGGCARQASRPASMPSARRGATMKLTTTAFTPEELLGGQANDSSTIPARYATEAGGGRNISLPFEWSDVPPGAKSLVLFIVDKAPSAKDWMHWVVVDISPEATGVPEGASGQKTMLPAGAVELRNTFGLGGYGGPQPPPGSGMHPYEANLYALDIPRLDVPQAPTFAQIESAASGHVLAAATCTGRFGR